MQHYSNQWETKRRDMPPESIVGIVNEASLKIILTFIEALVVWTCLMYRLCFLLSEKNV